MSALIGERSVDYMCSTFYTGMCSMCFESPLNKLWDAVSLESTTTDIFFRKNTITGPKKSDCTMTHYWRGFYNNGQVNQHRGNKMCVELCGEMAPRHRVGWKERMEIS